MLKAGSPLERRYLILDQRHHAPEESTTLLISGNCRRWVVLKLTMKIVISDDGQYQLRLICLMAKSEGSVCD